MDDLTLQTQRNPDYLLALPQVPRIGLQAASASGGKFWIAEAEKTGIAIRWGRVGTAGTLKHIPLSHCEQQNAALELKKRTLSKLRSGYVLTPAETALP